MIVRLVLGVVATAWSFFALAQAPQIVYTRAFVGDDYGYYHGQVLRAAVAATPEFGAAEVVPHSHPMPQGRQILTIRKGEADVMWSATSEVREQELIPIRLPLLLGFSGYRVLIIKQGKQAQYPLSLSDVQLRKRVAVQGIDWPDLAILRANRYLAEGADWSVWFASMFAMVEREVVDYFPRNIIEVHRDLRQNLHRKIALEQNHLLIYPNYEYFFVSHDKPELAKRINVGLQRIIANGHLAAIFQGHESHQEALALLDKNDRAVHTLTNPELGYSLSYANWIKNPETAIKALQKESKDLQTF